MQDEAAMNIGERKSAGHVRRLPLGALRTGYLSAARSCILFLPWRAQELSLHAIADTVSAARPEPLLPAHPGHDNHRRARIRAHHCRARLAHALSRLGCHIQAANAFKTGCGENERSRSVGGARRGVSSMFAAFARMHVHMTE